MRNALGRTARQALKRELERCRSPCASHGCLDCSCRRRAPGSAS